MPGSYATHGQQYAALADLYNVVAAAALTHPSVSPQSVQNFHLLKASEEVDEYLTQRYALPLVTWGDGLISKVCDIAAYHLICLRGFNPEFDGHFFKNYDRALKWLKEVANNEASPDVTDQSAQAPGVSAPAGQPAGYSPRRVNSTGTQLRGTWNR